MLKNKNISFLDSEDSQFCHIVTSKEEKQQWSQTSVSETDHLTAT